ncbi:MAG: hypothetical protein AAB504_01635 [Patescibacteria group bacterium]
MTAQEFIKKRSHLVWYIKNPVELSDESIVEHILNYGDWGDVQKLIAIMGVKKIALIFKKQIGRRRINYDDKIKNYFSFYFRKYA